MPKKPLEIFHWFSIGSKTHRMGMVSNLFTAANYQKKRSLAFSIDKKL